MLGKPIGILLFTRVALLTGSHLPHELRIADRARSDHGGVGGEFAPAIGRQTSCSQMCGPDIGRRCSA